MKQVSSLLGLSVLLTACCLAQDSRDALVFLTQLQNASQVKNADGYASFFGSSGTWDGPFGENAIGPPNIRNAVSRFFTRFGPLRTVMQSAHELTHDVVMVDVYQRTNRRGSFLDPALIAPGSGGPPRGADVRTTFLLHRQDGGWEIIAARVADLRAEKATVATR
jgi:hypothetical protein